MRHSASLVHAVASNILYLLVAALFFALESCHPSNPPVPQTSPQVEPADSQIVESSSMKTPLPSPFDANSTHSYPAPLIPIQTNPYPYPYPMATDLPAPTPQPTPEWPLYVDPYGGFTLRILPGWKAEEQPGAFSGPDGYLRSGYLPGMGYMQGAIPVCMRLANSPQGPLRRTYFSADSSCVLDSNPEMNIDNVRWVFENSTDRPERRFFYVEANATLIDAIVGKLVRLSIPNTKQWYRVPTGLLRTEDEVFWQSVGLLPASWEVEEIPIFENPEDSDQVYERYTKLPMDLKSWPFPVVLDQKATSTPEEGLLVEPNAILEKFGYRIMDISPSDRGPFAVYHQDQLVLDNISEFKPVLLNKSGTDFILSVTVKGWGYYLIQNGTVQYIDPGTTQRETSPVFFNDQAVAVFWVPGGGQQLQLKSGEKVLYAFATIFTTNTQLKVFQVWDEDWYMQIGDTLIRNGENLNASLGYEAIFNLRRFDDKIFYFFRKGPRVGISFDGKVLPLYYDEIQHLGCCGYGILNPRSSGNKIGFLALRDGMWYFVKLTIGES
jgi:hypothetical protein